MEMPRPEHPNPQFQRSRWRNLNGAWQFAIDQENSGEEKGLFLPDHSLPSEIVVPFCPESRLSGIAHKDFLHGVWYKRNIVLSQEECSSHVFLHFGAVDYLCRVYINGILAGAHKGGYVSFQFDITKLVHPGENCIAVFAQDETRDPMIPSGKQSSRYESTGCYYTRTTGIWQTVWLEFTPQDYIERVEYEPASAGQSVTIRTWLHGSGIFRAEASFDGRPMGYAQAQTQGGETVLTLLLQEVHLWDIGQGNLYDLKLAFGEDRVQSYFAIRTICLKNGCFYLNQRPVFQRLVLDQGFYPDGIYTAPTDEALARDIDLSMKMGFNGARLHEKVFEQRFLYHCDRKGYMVWGEYPNWGLDHTDPMAIYAMLLEWLEILRRDRNHPSIIGWCPFNETGDLNDRKQYDELLRLVYRTTKAVDPGRPCIDSSGWFHVETDIFDVHNYDQEPTEFKEKYDRLATENVLFDNFPAGSSLLGRQQYAGEPVMVSEFGGIQWSRDAHGWGYGQAPVSEGEFRSRLKGLVDALLDNPRMMGFCYTQLTDVEQEQNGLYTYERQPKLDPAWVKRVVSRSAVIERT